MSFTIDKINKDIIHLVFETKLEMNTSLVRYQEYYEHPKFAGKIFTYGQLREYFIKTEGGMKWLDEVDGCNFPSSVFTPFLTGLFDPLSPEEQDILDKVGRRSGNYYIIASAEETDEEDVQHEICHGLFNTNLEYRELIEAALSQHDMTHTFKWLKKTGYTKKVFNDEAHAYLLCNPYYMMEEKVPVNEDLVTELKLIRRLFKPEFIY